MKLERFGKQIELELFCTLTDEEIQSRGMMLVETVRLKDETNRAQKESAKAYRETLTGLDERQRDLSRIIRERAERRMVRCAVLFHAPTEGTKRIIRVDTGEIVREETMTQAELQLNIWDSQVEFEKYMKEQEVDSVTTEEEPAGESAKPDVSEEQE
jgi:hypothetical protein